jgi:phage baseplate assembly protein W
LLLEGKYLFSPTDEFKNLDLSNFQLIIEAFDRRIQEWLFSPLEKLLIDKRDFFVATAVECVLVDALAGFFFGVYGDTHKEDFTEFLRQNLGIQKDAATEFYLRFRCGILHQTNIKKCSSITTEVETLYFQKEDNVLFVNPIGFYKLLREFFTNYIKRLHNEKAVEIRFRTRFFHLFVDEFEECKWRGWWDTKTDYERDIRNSITSLLKTYKGEKESDPNFGLSASWIFGLRDKETSAGLREEIGKSLAVYEQRIETTDITVEFERLNDYRDQSKITIKYKTKATSTINQLIFLKDDII